MNAETYGVGSYEVGSEVKTLTEGDALFMGHTGKWGNERKIWNIDVSSMPKKADAHMREQVKKLKRSMSYNVHTGKVTRD